MKLKLVCVSWVDARTTAGWFDPREKIPNPPIKTYGLFVSHDDEHLTLGSTYDPESERFADKMEIPSGMVKSVKTIRVVEA